VGWEKVACWSTKATISLKHVNMEEKLLWSSVMSDLKIRSILIPISVLSGVIISVQMLISVIK